METTNKTPKIENENFFKERREYMFVKTLVSVWIQFFHHRLVELVIFSKSDQAMLVYITFKKVYFGIR